MDTRFEIVVTLNFSCPIEGKRIIYLIKENKENMGQHQ
jgi:hypothetical protein